MEENKKKHYVTPSMKVYEIEPTQLLTGSTEDVPTNTSVNNGMTVAVWAHTICD